MEAAADWTPYAMDWGLGLWRRCDWKPVLWADDWDEVRCVHRLRCCWFRSDVSHLRDVDHLRRMTWEHVRCCGGTGADPTDSGILIV